MMNSKRRRRLQAIGGGGVMAAATPYLSAPAFAQSGPLKVGIIAPSIDAFSPKNEDLSPAAVTGILCAAGLLTECGGDPLLESRARDQIASDLFDRELVKTLIAVEGIDHPVPIRPDIARVV